MEEFSASVNGSAVVFASQGRDVYFAGRLIYQRGEQVFTDRLGSVALRRENGAWVKPKYYPYGELRAGTSEEDQTGFATYERSALTGLDYAQQRYYASGAGRFLSADPYRASGGAGNPGSWNRYAYVEGDPVNNTDPAGLYIFAGGYTGVEIYCTSVWSPEGSEYVCSPEFAYTLEYFGESTLAQQTQGGGGGGVPGDGPIARFSRLSQPCQNGLMTAMPAAAGTAPSVRAQLRLDALGRAGGVTGILARIAGEHGIDWELLAAVGIRESGFRDVLQSDGAGAGVFQIDLGKNPSVKLEDARNFEWAADWAANRLATNMATLAAAHPNFTRQQLLMATAASYNFGVKNISGNPDTIDVGSSGHNYGSNVLHLMDCF